MMLRLCDSLEELFGCIAFALRRREELRQELEIEEQMAPRYVFHLWDELDEPLYFVDFDETV